MINGKFQNVILGNQGRFVYLLYGLMYYHNISYHILFYSILCNSFPPFPLPPSHPFLISRRKINNPKIIHHTNQIPIPNPKSQLPLPFPLTSSQTKPNQIYALKSPSLPTPPSACRPILAFVLPILRFSLASTLTGLRPAPITMRALGPTIKFPIVGDSSRVLSSDLTSFPFSLDIG